MQRGWSDVRLVSSQLCLGIDGSEEETENGTPAETKESTRLRRSDKKEVDEELENSSDA